MPLNIDDKKLIVADLVEQFKVSTSAVLADYKGLAAADMTTLRAQAQKANVKVRVARNTLVKRAVKGTPFECINEKLVGPVLLMLSGEEPGAAARLARDFAKGNKKLEVTSLALDSQLLDVSQLTVVANLPTKDEAISMLMGTMMAPVTQLVRTMAEPCALLARTLLAVQNSKSE